MSTSSHPHERQPTRVCRYPGCDTRGTSESFPTHQYCSHACDTRHDGLKTLREIFGDHKWCSNCGRRLKHVTGVPPEWFWSGFQTETKQAFTGYQFRTPAATIGEIELDGPLPRITTGTTCGECGQTDTSDHLPWDDHPRLIEAVGFLCDAIATETDTTVDHETVLHTLIETRDVEYSIGRGTSS